MAGWDIATVFFERLDQAAWVEAAGQALFGLIVACLIWGGIIYQLTRFIHLQRCMNHRPATDAQLQDLLTSRLPSLTVLVPAYKEEPRVVTQTLLSAALQSYDTHRVVLLIDDPPAPATDADAIQLRMVRALPGQVRDLLGPEAEHFIAEREAFELRRAVREIDSMAETRRLASSFERASGWFARQARIFDADDPGETVFREKFLLSRCDALRVRARELSESPHQLTEWEIVKAYDQLAQLFSAEITSFERKRYVNLSHEPNKAMNLNSYLVLIGKTCRERLSCEGLNLDVVTDGPFDLEVPDADYVITLDADSLLVPDYALRLVHVAEQPGNERLAVVQTPYSAFPNSTGTLERVAGATTDIQYNIHQGFSGWNATYWVGANALIRKAALDDIADVVVERGYPVPVYIQDRTVIEDTESTVDLIARGWRLFNYPERLAYSATPPDFGSLIIQRRRWANGGLIILPKLLRYFFHGKKSLEKFGEAFCRIHYLVSITAVNVALPVILAIPFTDSVRTWWLPLTALPYFCLYVRDLQLAGYRAGDFVRVYSLNLVLIPINLGGVLKSLQQGWTGNKIPFGRTPKVKDRTAAPPLYIAALYALIVHWFVQAGLDLASGLWVHGSFAAVNATLLLYGVAVFVGFHHSWEDLRAPLARRRQPRTERAADVRDYAVAGESD